MQERESTQNLVARLQRRAASRAPRPRVTAHEVQQLLARQHEAERAGVRFLSDGLVVNGVQFQLGA